MSPTPNSAAERRLAAANHLLWLHGDPDQETLAVTLAEVLAVPLESVDVNRADVDDRNWAAPVLCEVFPIGGDLRQQLDIGIRGQVSKDLSTAVLAAALSARLGSAVLYESSSRSPNSFWIVGPDGLRTRARIRDDEYDDADLNLFRLQAIEHPVATVQGVEIAPIPEVIDGYRMPTPLSDRFQEPLKGVDGAWKAADRLAAWEGMITRLERGWPPDGWYPAEGYRRKLECRDELETLADRVPAPLRAEFDEALAVLDRRFAEATVDDAGQALSAVTGPTPGYWWWQRITDPSPWHAMPDGTAQQGR